MIAGTIIATAGALSVVWLPWAHTTIYFGSTFIIWDRIFGTYIKDPKKGQSNIVIGIIHIQKEGEGNSFKWTKVIRTLIAVLFAVYLIG